VPLTLTVDGPAWDSHLDRFAAARPGIIPVCKGNGYGFGLPRVLERAARLPGVDTVAVGTMSELAAVPASGLASDCDVLVLTPDPAAEVPTGGPCAERVVRTASTVGDVEVALAGGHRFVVECRTDLQRHGVAVEDLRELAAVLSRYPDRGGLLEGWGLHLPLARPWTWSGVVEQRVGALRAAGLDPATVHVSHLSVTELAVLATSLAGTRLRPRVGTDLWLGDRAALVPTATVLDVHRLPRGAPAGYWQRHAPGPGWVVVAAGGTAHGIGLTAPPPPTTRRRLGALRTAVGDSTGRARSPFIFDGVALDFFEPPHMQVSLLWLPAAGGRHRPSRPPEPPAPPPRRTELMVRVRYTTTTFDRVVVTGG